MAGLPLPEVHDKPAVQGPRDFLESQQGDVGMLEGLDVGDHLLRGLKPLGELRLAQPAPPAQLGDAQGAPSPQVLLRVGLLDPGILEQLNQGKGLPAENAEGTSAPRARIESPLATAQDLRVPRRDGSVRRPASSASITATRPACAWCPGDESLLAAEVSG